MFPQWFLTLGKMPLKWSKNSLLSIALGFASVRYFSNYTTGRIGYTHQICYDFKLLDNINIIRHIPTLLKSEKSEIHLFLGDKMDIPYTQSPEALLLFSFYTFSSGLGLIIVVFFISKLIGENIYTLANRVRSTEHLYPLAQMAAFFSTPRNFLFFAALIGLFDIFVSIILSICAGGWYLWNYVTTA